MSAKLWTVPKVAERLHCSRWVMIASVSAHLEQQYGVRIPPGCKGRKERPREEKRSLVGSPGAFGAMSDSGEGDGRGELSGRRRESLLGVGEKKRSTRRAKMPHGTKIRSKRLIG